jgi:hypothetical protein
VSKFLGHQNLSTTTRYLNTTLRGLHRAVERLELHRRKPDGVANSLQSAATEQPEIALVPANVSGANPRIS